MDDFEEPDESADISDEERYFSMLADQTDLTEEQIEQDMDYISQIPDSADMIQIKRDSAPISNVISDFSELLNDPSFDQTDLDSDDIIDISGISLDDSINFSSIHDHSIVPIIDDKTGGETGILATELVEEKIKKENILISDEDRIHIQTRPTSDNTANNLKLNLDGNPSESHIGTVSQSRLDQASPKLRSQGRLLAEVASSLQSINLSDSNEVISVVESQYDDFSEHIIIPDVAGLSSQEVELPQPEVSRSQSVGEMPKPVIPEPAVIHPHKQQVTPVTTPTSYFSSTPSIIQPLSTFPDDDGINTASTDPSEPGIDSELWLPNSDTVELLRQSSIAPLDTQYLTQAVPSNDTPFVNPAVELVLKYHGESAASKLSKPLPAAGEEGLRQLIKQGKLMSALNMLTELLTSTTMSPKIIQLWSTRFALLVKLKLYSNAEVEMTMFGTLETVDLYYEYYPNEWLHRRGSIVPWSMRLLWAILPLHSNSSGGLYGAVDRMYGIVDHLDTALLAGLPYGQEQRVIKYKVSVLVQIAGVLAGSGGMQPAIKVLTQLKALQPSLSNVVTSAMARLFFQLGNVQKGDALLASVASLLSSEEASMNSGFSSLAHGNYNEAYQHFARVCSINPHNTVASNNGAVCLLYLGRLSDSIAQFECAVSGSLHPMLLFNLVSLYELQTASSTNKKCKLLETLTQTERDGFPYECLRL